MSCVIVSGELNKTQYSYVTNKIKIEHKSTVKQNCVFDCGFLFYLVLIVPQNRTVQAKACVNVVPFTVCTAWNPSSARCCTLWAVCRLSNALQCYLCAKLMTVVTQGISNLTCFLHQNISDTTKWCFTDCINSNKLCTFHLRCFPSLLFRIKTATCGTDRRYGTGFLGLAHKYLL